MVAVVVVERIDSSSNDYGTEYSSCHSPDGLLQFEALLHFSTAYSLLDRKT